MVIENHIALNYGKNTDQSILPKHWLDTKVKLKEKIF